MVDKVAEVGSGGRGKAKKGSAVDEGQPDVTPGTSRQIRAAAGHAARRGLTGVSSFLSILRSAARREAIPAR